MKYVIDSKEIAKHNLTLSQFFIIMAVKTGLTNRDLPSLKAKEVLRDLGTSSLNGYPYAIAANWNDIADSILLDSEKVVNNDKNLEDLATALIDIFPKGKKPGTNYYWKSNKTEVVLKLKKFFKVYGAKRYSYDDIIEATKRYVACWNGDYQLMRLLKYFIMKEDGSDLATFLENKDETDDNWLNELR